MIPAPHLAAARARAEPGRGRRIEVKVCGLTRAVDARTTLEAGADYLGLVFAESRRRVTVEAAGELTRQVPEARWVGVFAGAPVDRMTEIAERLGLSAVQLHGDSDDGAIDRLRAAGIHVWRAIGVEQPADPAGLVRRCDELDGRVQLVLLDREADGRMGGGGVPLDWSALPRELREGLRSSRLGVSGGLGPENVATALAGTGADLVDASSRLEAAPGRKDPERVRRFVSAVRASSGARPVAGTA